MTVSYVEYELQSGYIMNWLVAGPQEISGGMNSNVPDLAYKKQIVEKYSTAKQEISTLPVERGPLTEGVFSIGDYQGEWSYYRCKEDHLVDLSTSSYANAYVRAWAYTQLTWDDDVNATITLITENPVDIWINKKLVLHYSDFPRHRLEIPFQASLKKGMNKVMVRIANVADPQAVLAFGMQINAGNTGGKVRIPTLIPSISRRNQLEAIFDQIYLERDIHAPGDLITLVYPEDLEAPTYTDARLQTSTGRIYGQAYDIGKPGDVKKLGTPAALPHTTYQVYVTPRDWEYYESNIRITQRFNVWSSGKQRFSPEPYGDLESRRKEALAYASTVENSVFAEIAKIARGDWTNISPEIIRRSFDSIQKRRAGSEVELLGILGVLSRYGSQPELPEWLKDEAAELAIHFDYSRRAKTSTTITNPENDDLAIVTSACAILAGQLFPASTFHPSGLSAEQLRQEHEQFAYSWMMKRGNYGFAAWDSKELYSQILAALSYLVDLAQSEEVWELASVLMDKMFFTIALNSLKGVYGSSQGFASTLDIKSGLMEPTSGITRLMWGMGVYNLQIAGTVSLACMTNYELPPIIAEIAAGSPESLLNKEQQAAAEIPVNKVTYKTPEYMLSSAQSYRPGEPGEREHIWQATLGEQSIVFVNHPGCSSETDAHAPNYWLGNGTLPRVAQIENTLVAIYNSSTDSIIDFTHAYFPVVEFDEFAIQGNTAFARKGHGYIALTAKNGLEQITSGRTAFREIRSPGRQNIWVCQMGRAANDGNFSDFQEKISCQELTFDQLSLQLKTPKGDIFLFGWHRPLVYNNMQQDLSSFPHYHNPYTISGLPCQQMQITNADFLLKLNFH